MPVFGFWERRKRFGARGLGEHGRCAAWRGKWPSDRSVRGGIPDRDSRLGQG
jgi:hypothetical protein